MLTITKRESIMLDGQEHEVGMMFIQDPCYDVFTANGFRCFAGSYIVNRTRTRLEFVHSVVRHQLAIPQEELGVDSGQMSLIDAAYLLSKQREGDTGEYGDRKTFYGRACIAGEDNEGALFEFDEKRSAHAFCCSTNYGDCCYPFVAYLVGHEPGSILAGGYIEFEEEQDEEEQEEDEQDEDW